MNQIHQYTRIGGKYGLDRSNEENEHVTNSDSSCIDWLLIWIWRIHYCLTEILQNHYLTSLD